MMMFYKGEDYECFAKIFRRSEQTSPLLPVAGELGLLFFACISFASIKSQLVDADMVLLIPNARRLGCEGFETRGGEKRRKTFLLHIWQKSS